MPKIERLDHIALVVSDLDRSEKWYTDLFGLVPVYKNEWWTTTERFFSAGETIVALFQNEDIDPPPRNRNKPGCHFAFRTDRASFEQYLDELPNRDISFRFEDYKVTRALYFSDPDGYQIEITTYIE